MNSQTTTLVFTCLLLFNLNVLANGKCQTCPKEFDKKPFRLMEMQELRYVKCFYASEEDYKNKKMMAYSYKYYKVTKESNNRFIAIDKHRGKWSASGNTHWCKSSNPKDCQFIFHSKWTRDVNC